ncbi:hypothetical protein LTR62_007257 [Meristemomyces frigidus]|uniref:Aromatic amino acid beta-eliminating lyase/threonine aldolase domain-containing protein n=1 Tax=Meristemomyces frigidus TaxID=1508187 RepID=A0AAN7TC50_9PEZI|nr:hypothetical protein LTR62_007257 [Meristemomyces frigidus]
MAATAETIVTATCEEVDTPVTEKDDPIQLCMFMEPMTAAESIKRTARYAKNPAAYLQNILGDQTFQDRKSMLSLADEVNRDFYGTGTYRQHFEQHIARLMGKKHGLFFLTGVQAQLAAIKIHCDVRGRQRAAWHISSHLQEAEERAYEELYRLDRILLGSDPETLPKVEEITAVLHLSENERPSAILLELPNRVLGCKTYTYADLEQISLACRQANVALHMDGARLWEIEPYYQRTAGKTFSDLAALFDTVYVSFYKGLGGATGAMLVSNDQSLMNEAKVWQRRAGGNAFSLGYEVIDCERGYNQTIGEFQGRWEKMSEIVEGIKAATAEYKASDGRPIVGFIAEEPRCCQVLTVFHGFSADALVAARDAVEKKTNVRVFERLRPKQSLDEKMKAEREAAVGGGEVAGSKGEGAAAVPEGREGGKEHFMEWMIMAVTQKIETRVFIEAYVALCEELLRET